MIFGQNDFKSYFVTANRGVAEAWHSNTTRPRPLAAPLPSLPAACVVLNIKQRTIFWSACIGVFTRCDRRGDRSRDWSPRSVACLFTRCNRRSDRSRDRLHVCFHGAIAATIASCKHRIRYRRTRSSLSHLLMSSCLDSDRLRDRLGKRREWG